MVSLYRPGPMQFISTYIDGKHGKKKVVYLHDSVKSVLEETYGIAIYQEQILEIAKQFAGFSLGEADLLRRAIGKKIAAELVAQREKFLDGAMKQERDRRLAAKIFDEVIEPFAGYGFNKSHAACYALISYQTAYLKAHFPAEFMAALLTSDADNTDRVVIEIAECRNMGISVLPPSVNESRAHFTVVDEKTIRFGLMAVKGMGEGPVHEIIRTREKEGVFTGLENFAQRVPAKLLNKKSIECMAFSGAMDDLGERAEIATNYDEISNFAKNIQSSLSEGQTDIFGVLTDSSVASLKFKKIAAADSAQRFRWEKEYLGLYVSGHPLQGLKHYFQGKGKLIGSLGEKDVDKKVKITGMITQMRKVLTKAGKYMAMGDFEDPSARVSFVLFPRAYDQFGSVLEEDRVFTVEGRLDKRGGDYQFVVDSLKPLSLENMVTSAREKNLFDEDERIIGVQALRSEEAEEEEEGLVEGVEAPAAPVVEAGPYVIALDKDFPPEKLKKLKALLERYQGETVVEIHMPTETSLKRVKVPFGVDTGLAMQEEVKALMA
jgi:DNA polymerase-3 subunit alpha